MVRQFFVKLLNTKFHKVQSSGFSVVYCLQRSGLMGEVNRRSAEILVALLTQGHQLRRFGSKLCGCWDPVTRHCVQKGSSTHPEMPEARV
jgi:hypothetical protein